MYYIESGVAPLNTNNLKPHTQQFQTRCKRKWSTMIPILLTSMELQNIPTHWNEPPKHRVQGDNERKYRNCKSVCDGIYRYKEHKWLSKHKFMLYSPLPLPSDVLRQVFVCLYGHGP